MIGFSFWSYSQATLCTDRFSFQFFYCLLNEKDVINIHAKSRLLTFTIRIKIDVFPSSTKRNEFSFWWLCWTVNACVQCNLAKRWQQNQGHFWNSHPHKSQNKRVCTTRIMQSGIPGRKLMVYRILCSTHAHRLLSTIPYAVPLECVSIGPKCFQNTNKCSNHNEIK